MRGISAGFVIEILILVLFKPSFTNISYAFQLIKWLFRLPMSVEMNYPMVQYLRKALKNEKAAVQELNRLLGFPKSISPDCDKSDSYLQVEKRIGMFCKLKG